MPGRIIPLIDDETYHIFNRGSEKRHIFLQQRDYRRFRQTFQYYQTIGPKKKFSNFTKLNLLTFSNSSREKHVEILCYCLMPNHFHFLLRQLRKGGISSFISKVCNSYAKYFNTKYKRIGPLFQGRFGSVRIETEEQLMHVSRYIHINPVVCKLISDIDDYVWSSFSEYSSELFSSLCSQNEILGFFPSREKYREFVKDQIEYGQTLDTIKHHLMEDDF